MAVKREEVRRVGRERRSGEKWRRKERAWYWRFKQRKVQYTNAWRGKRTEWCLVVTHHDNIQHDLLLCKLCENEINLQVSTPCYVELWRLLLLFPSIPFFVYLYLKTFSTSKSIYSPSSTIHLRLYFTSPLLSSLSSNLTLYFPFSSSSSFLFLFLFHILYSSTLPFN